MSGAPIHPTIEAADRRAWRAWLRAHHARESEIWLVFYKKHVGQSSVSYPESVEEAICWGWIDGLKKRIDEQRYAHRFTPRKSGSRWSVRNLEIAERMIAKGRMTRAGREAFERRRLYETGGPGSATPSDPELPPQMERELRRAKKAWANFEQLAPSHRRRYVAWLASAKRESTRKKRLAEAIALLAEGRDLGMK